MAVPELDFSTDDWLQIPIDTTEVRLTILARPPVAASAGLVVFTRLESEESPTWKKLKQGEVDNIPKTQAGEFTRFTVIPGNLYCIKLQGEAHVLLPGYKDLEVGFRLDMGAKSFDYGGTQTANSRAAALTGLTYLQFKEA